MFIKQGKGLYRIASHPWRYFPCKTFCRQMSSFPEVIFEEVGNKGVVTLNRPKNLNALNLGMVRLIYPKLKEWEKNKLLVIIKGAGEKAFCAGGDVLSVTESRKHGGSYAKDFFKEEYLLNCLIGTYHIPYISFIDGITMGGGVGLSVHGQYRIATERTLFAMPETGIGLFPDVGGSYFLPRLGGNLGIYLALTGHRLKGRDVLRAGVATHVCDSTKLGDLEKTLLNISSSSYQEDVTKAIQSYSDTATFGKNVEFTLKPYEQQIFKCFSGDSVEEVISNLEADGSDWAKKQLSLLAKMSPTSLKITFESLKRGAHSTLQECLSTEYRLTQRCCEDHDLYEGARAILVDKDNSPQWKPKSLSEVTEDVVSRYFSPLPDQDELVF